MGTTTIHELFRRDGARLNIETENRKLSVLTGKSCPQREADLFDTIKMNQKDQSFSTIKNNKSLVLNHLDVRQKGEGYAHSASLLIDGSSTLRIHTPQGLTIVVTPPTARHLDAGQFVQKPKKLVQHENK